MNLFLGHSMHAAHREPVHLETLQVRPVQVIGSQEHSGQGNCPHPSPQILFEHLGIEG
jgi:hypothetical protein